MVAEAYQYALAPAMLALQEQWLPLAELA